MNNKLREKSIPVDSFGLRLRSILLNQASQSILISDLRDSEQATDIHNINCMGYGRVWHKSVEIEENWGEIVLPYYPAAWKLGISRKEASVIQVFQSAGCNYRCWFCYVDYRLLKGDIQHAKYFTCDEMVSMLQKESYMPKVIRLSGGQPDLTPEWTIWMMKTLISKKLDDKTYLWLDDNLSNYYSWEIFNDEDWNFMLNYKNFGRVGCLKGYDHDSFHFNTKAPSEHFDRQLDILDRLVKIGLDIYVYLVLTTPHLKHLDQNLKQLVDRLQAIHPNLPLRVCPLKIKPYSPTTGRMKDSESESMQYNQYVALDKWKSILSERFTLEQLALPCYEVTIR